MPWLQVLFISTKQTGKRKKHPCLRQYTNNSIQFYSRAYVYRAKFIWDFFCRTLSCCKPFFPIFKNFTFTFVQFFLFAKQYNSLFAAKVRGSINPTSSFFELSIMFLRVLGHFQRIFKKADIRIIILFWISIFEFSTGSRI